MKQMIKPLLGIVMITCMLLSCNNGSSEKTDDSGNTDKTDITRTTTVKNGEQMNSLIAHFNKNGFTGERSEKSFETIGAIDGVAYENEDFSIELYEFNAPKDISKELIYQNGIFGMLIHRPSNDLKDELIATFNSFK